jgi:hypothetical protein
MLLNFESPNAGAFAFPLAGAALPYRCGEVQQSCRSRRTWRMGNGGFPGTWEVLTVSTGHKRQVGVAAPKYSGPTEPASAAVGAKQQTNRVVPPSEGNEARREGRQEVVAP